jgi:hypothetical protein
MVVSGGGGAAKDIRAGAVVPRFQLEQTPHLGPEARRPGLGGMPVPGRKWAPLAGRWRL